MSPFFCGVWPTMATLPEQWRSGTDGNEDQRSPSHFLLMQGQILVVVGMDANVPNGFKVIPATFDKPNVFAGNGAAPLGKPFPTVKRLAQPQLHYIMSESFQSEVGTVSAGAGLDSKELPTGYSLIA